MRKELRLSSVEVSEVELVPNGRPLPPRACHSASTADPASPAEVAGRCLSYLSQQLRVSDLRYEVEPHPIPNGWETYTYGLQLEETSSLPLAFARPLILRIFASPQGVPRLHHEFASQRFLYEIGYPVAEPLLREESCDLFGGPFQIMEQIPEVPLVEGLVKHPWRLLHAAHHMAQIHARLHRLSPDGFPAPPEPFLGRRLDEIRQLVRAHDLSGLNRGLDWLGAHRPAESVSRHILHLDFHPLNLLGGLESVPVVLDWTEADVGDYHADLATTLMFFACSPLRGQTCWERVALGLGGFFWRRWYLRFYRWHMPVDPVRLRYYRAWATLRRLSIYGRWLRAGPQSNGCKPSVLRHLVPDQLAVLQRDFHRSTGVEVSL